MLIKTNFSKLKILAALFLMLFAADCFAANKSYGIYVRPVKLRVVDEQTGLPVQGLKVYSIVEIKYDILWVNQDIKYYINEYETDINGEAYILENHITDKPGFYLDYQHIIINADCIDENISEEEAAYTLKWVILEEPDVNGQTFTPEKKYKNVQVIYDISDCDKTEVDSNRYLQSYHISYSYNKKNKFKSFIYDEDELEIKIQKRAPVPKGNIDIKSGEHKLYDWQHKSSTSGNEVGHASITKKNDSYYFSFEGNAYTENDTYHNSTHDYKKIKIDDAVLTQIAIPGGKTPASKAEIDCDHILTGDYDGKKIFVFKYLHTLYIPNAIEDDYREYYFMIILPEEESNKIINTDFSVGAYDFMYHDKAFYKAWFYEDLQPQQ